MPHENHVNTNIVSEELATFKAMTDFQYAWQEPLHKERRIKYSFVFKIFSFCHSTVSFTLEKALIYLERMLLLQLRNEIWENNVQAFQIF